ncbi:MAG: hypothetical protein ACI8W1_000109 [Candidatus Azotimanducaceae bacterium]|jgi:hypothetical protein
MKRKLQVKYSRHLGEIMKTKYDIDTESDHDQVMKLINDRKKPSAILRLLMNAFEGYRQSRKLGWSRPWNKVNLINFQSFRVSKSRDQNLLSYANDIIKRDCQNMSTPAAQFAENLINHSESLMAFIFIHEFTEKGQLYEGATLSLGRKNNKRYRDRLDIIVESPIADGISQGFKRLRVYVDPYTSKKAPLWCDTLFPDATSASAELFERLSEISTDWQFEKDKRWDHWTSDYVDYFGPRQKYIENSFFHQNVFHPHKGAVMNIWGGQHVQAD